MQTCLHIHPRGILIHRVYLALACQILCIARFVWHTSHQIWWWWFALTHSDTDTDMHTSVQRHAEHIDTRYYYMSYGLKWFEVVSRRKDEWVNEWASELDRAEQRERFVRRSIESHVPCVYTTAHPKCISFFFHSDSPLSLPCIVSLSLRINKKEIAVNSFAAQVFLKSNARVFVCHFERRMKDLLLFLI